MRNFILYVHLDLATASLFAPDFFHSVLAIPKTFREVTIDRGRRYRRVRTSNRQSLKQAESFFSLLLYRGPRLFMVVELYLSFNLWSSVSRLIGRSCIFVNVFVDVAEDFPSKRGAVDCLPAWPTRRCLSLSLWRQTCEKFDFTRSCDLSISSWFAINYT